MTAPALPGAAPDPARLPPEVEATMAEAFRRAIEVGYDAAPDDKYFGAGNTEVAMDVLLASKPVAALRTAIARALGGDGEPVGPDAKSMIEAIRLIGVALGQDDDWVDFSPALVEFAAERIRSLYTRPAATGDTGEVERARAKVVDAAIALRMADAAYVALHTSVKDDDDALQEARGRLDHLHAARMNKRFDLDAYTTELLAATGGPDAR